MPTVRLAAASLNQTPIDWSGNLRRAVAAIDAARVAGARLICLPELCLSGYGCEDLFFADHVRERAIGSLAELTPHTRGVAAVVGLPFVVGGRLYNAVAMVVDGEVLGMSLKQHLANDGIHYEARWFHPWPAGETATAEVAGRPVPVGDLVYDLAGVRVGVEVCRDAWVADRPALRLADRGVGVLLNPSASHFAFGKQAIRRRLVTEGAAAIGGAYVYTNLLGNEAGRAIYDGGALFALARSRGGAAELAAEGRRFSYADHTLTWIDAAIHEAPAGGPAEGVIGSRFSIASDGAPEELTQPRAEVDSKLEEFSRAAPLGLFDYLRKSGARGFVLSLSGALTRRRPRPASD